MQIQNFFKKPINILKLLAVLIVSWFIVINPLLKKLTYKDCFDFASETGKININQTELKSFVDLCVKAGGAGQFRSEKEAREKLWEKQAEERRLTEEKEKIRSKENEKRKSLTSEEMDKIKIINARFTKNGMQGKIQNDNDFDISDINIKITSYSDKNFTNKIGEGSCGIREFTIFSDGTISHNYSENMTVFQKTNKVFHEDCYPDYENFYYRFELNSVSKKT